MQRTTAKRSVRRWCHRRARRATCRPTRCSAARPAIPTPSRQMQTHIGAWECHSLAQTWDAACRRVGDEPTTCHRTRQVTRQPFKPNSDYLELALPGTPTVLVPGPVVPGIAPMADVPDRAAFGPATVDGVSMDDAAGGRPRDGRSAVPGSATGGVCSDCAVAAAGRTQSPSRTRPVRRGGTVMKPPKVISGWIEPSFEQQACVSFPSRRRRESHE